MRLALVRIRVVAGAPLDRSSVIHFGFGKQAATVTQSAHRVATANVPRIAPQALTIVVLWLSGCVAILLEVQPGQVKRLHGAKFFGLLDGLGRLGNLLFLRSLRAPGDEWAPRRIGDHHLASVQGLLAAQVHSALKPLPRPGVEGFVQQHSFTAR